MPTINLHSLDAEALRELALQSIRQHWVKPRRSPAPGKLRGAELDRVSREVLDVMMTRQFRVGPLPPQDVYDQLLDRVRRKVRRGEPIYVTAGYSPLKNPVSVPHSHADWAEFFSLSHLVAWHNKVQAVYGPGLQIRIVFDDTTLALANRADRKRMNDYMSSIASLIDALGYRDLFLPSFGHSSFSWLFHFGIYQVAAWFVRRWERDPANAAQIERMHEYASRNVLVPPDLDPAAREDYIRAASHRYRVYWEALQLSGVTHSVNRIVAMYLDGTQHHIRQAVALHLTTLGKGQITQPWQGEGCLVDNGHGKLVPFVLTGGRRSRHTLRTLEGLDLVPCEGFDRIAIAWPEETETSEALANVPEVKLPTPPSTPLSTLPILSPESERVG